jgi:bifunctional non-homologous end joining protein LigD
VQDGRVGTSEERGGVRLTNLDEQLFPDAGASKRDLIDYLDTVADRLIPEITDRPLSVIRVLRGQTPFMQKNVPKYTPEWVRTTTMWAESSKREVVYALCNDRRTLLWFGNQRAIEYHPTLFRIDDVQSPTYLIIDIDPPEGESFGLAVQAAHLVRAVLSELNMNAAVKTSGAKGVHVVVPVTPTPAADVAAATRALAARAEELDPALTTTEFVRADRGGKVFLDSTRAGGATVVSVFSPRVREGLPVSFPVPWESIDSITPRDFTIRTAWSLLGCTNPWTDLLPEPQALSADLVAEGHQIPIARVQAMHEGKRRARERRGSP